MISNSESTGTRTKHGTACILLGNKLAKEYVNFVGIHAYSQVNVCIIIKYAFELFTRLLIQPESKKLSPLQQRYKSLGAYM